jgi:hypothetical protein
MCHSDSDCQTMCPAVSSGTNCCDLTSNTCFPMNGSSCPAGQDAGPE